MDAHVEKRPNGTPPHSPSIRLPPPVTARTAPPRIVYLSKAQVLLLALAVFSFVTGVYKICTATVSLNAPINEVVAKLDPTG